MVGTIKGFTIGKNKDGDKNVLLLQVEITDPEDVQTIQLYKQAGEDTNPPINSEAIIAQLGEAWKIAIATDDGIEPSMNAGEKKLYSSSGGEIKAFINFLADGVLELNGNTDNVTRFNALEIGFNQLRNDFNLFLTHVHSGVVTGGGNSGPPNPPVIPSTADISGAKVEEVKIK
jgi:phage gp45-like